ncbi:MAG TPA: hypothetical protein VMF57_19490 [Solirubrobacteraceae bacterium]|nr:hypothetical protein [Solirubrobacteraceae bacterium]
MTKRVIECNICGEPLAAATDEELLGQMGQHYAREHPDASLEEEEARETISEEAYDAADS